MKRNASSMMCFHVFIGHPSSSFTGAEPQTRCASLAPRPGAGAERWVVRANGGARRDRTPSHLQCAPHPSPSLMASAMRRVLTPSHSPLCGTICHGLFMQVRCCTTGARRTASASTRRPSRRTATTSTMSRILRSPTSSASRSRRICRTSRSASSRMPSKW